MMIESETTKLARKYLQGRQVRYDPTDREGYVSKVFDAPSIGTIVQVTLDDRNGPERILKYPLLDFLGKSNINYTED